jgi:hypothetical protein
MLKLEFKRFHNLHTRVKTTLNNSTKCAESERKKGKERRKRGGGGENAFNSGKYVLLPMPKGSALTVLGPKTEFLAVALLYGKRFLPAHLNFLFSYLSVQSAA